MLCVVCVCVCADLLLASSIGLKFLYVAQFELIVSQAKFVDPVTGLDTTAYESLTKFQSRDSQNIQVSTSVTDGKIQVQPLRHLYHCVAMREMIMNVSLYSA